MNSHSLDRGNLAAAQSAPDEREAFEACMRIGGYSNPEKHPDGSYVSSAMELWWQGWKARAAWQRAQSAAGVPASSIYVEFRRCDKCEHGGINDAATGVAACHDCAWTGPEPVEDKCPGCHSENCMAAACPECGGRYVLLASEDIDAPAHPAPRNEQAGEWIACSERLPQIKSILSEPCELEGKAIPTLYRSGEVVTFNGKRVTAGIVEWFHGQLPVGGITHWAPLPAAPTLSQQADGGVKS